MDAEGPACGPSEDEEEPCTSSQAAEEAAGLAGLLPLQVGGRRLACLMAAGVSGRVSVGFCCRALGGRGVVWEE